MEVMFWLYDLICCNVRAHTKFFVKKCIELCKLPCHIFYYP